MSFPHRADCRLLARYLRAAARYHGPRGLVVVAPETADRFMLPRLMTPAEARREASTLEHLEDVA